jgi:hypothetical protein
MYTYVWFRPALHIKAFPFPPKDCGREFFTFFKLEHCSRPQRHVQTVIACLGRRVLTDSPTAKNKMLPVSCVSCILLHPASSVKHPASRLLRISVLHTSLNATVCHVLSTGQRRNWMHKKLPRESCLRAQLYALLLGLFLHAQPFWSEGSQLIDLQM